jgi:hypothetical protein
MLHERLVRRLPRHPAYDFDLLVALTCNRAWIPDVLCPTPTPGTGEPTEELAALQETDPDVAEDDLARLRVAHPGSRLARMGAQEFLEATTQALTGYWRAVLEPMWERVRSITEADIAFHREVLAAEGLEGAIPRLHDELSMSDGSVRAAMHSEQRVNAAGGGLWLLPSVFRWPWLAVDIRTNRPVISYAARGPAGSGRPRTGPSTPCPTCWAGPELPSSRR